VEKKVSTDGVISGLYPSYLGKGVPNAVPTIKESKQHKL
jgi:hypothetical protein